MFGSTIDAKDRLRKDETKERSSEGSGAPFWEEVFQNDGTIENDRLENDVAYVDSNDDKPEKISKELYHRLKEAAENGLSEKQ